MGSRTIGKLYPIALDDYPKLLRYKVSEKGIYYIEDLIREIYVEQKDLSLNKLTQLGLLLKTYICQSKRVDEEVMFQDISNRARKLGGIETFQIKDILQRLMMRDLLGPNPKYDPRIAIRIHQKNLD
jgi:hypothetical protein